MYGLRIKDSLHKKFKKLGKKNSQRIMILNKKILEIRKNPYRYKPLSGNLHGKYRVHIDTSFVLIFSIDEEQKRIIAEDFDHHDNIYTTSS